MMLAYADHAIIMAPDGRRALTNAQSGVEAMEQAERQQVDPATSILNTAVIAASSKALRPESPKNRTSQN